MIVKKNPEIRQLYLKELEKFINGEKSLPESRLSRDLTKGHKSDALNCLLTGYYARTVDNPPPINITMLLNISLGRAFERMLSVCGELEPKEKDGILVTPDDMVDGVLTEIKMTKETFELFNPVESHPDWVKGMMAECEVYNTNIHHLAVGFIAGNMQSKSWFGQKLHKQAGIIPLQEWVNSAFEVWTFEFTKAEIKENWNWLKERIDYLFECIEKGQPPSMATITLDLQDKKWLCKNCRWGSICDYYNLEENILRQ